MFETIPLFQGLDPEEIETLEAHAHPRTYRKHTIILERGDESSSLYFIEKGKVKVFVADDEGKEVVLNTLGPGDYFGELALLGEIPRTASVISLEDTRCRILGRHDFLDLVRERPQIALNLIHHLVAQVDSLTDKVSTLALRDVYGRVVATLMEQAREEDGRLITPPLTQQEIAARVGASREMISRIFRELRQGGYIALDKKRVVIQRKLPARW